MLPEPELLKRSQYFTPPNTEHPLDAQAPCIFTGFGCCQWLSGQCDIGIIVTLAGSVLQEKTDSVRVTVVKLLMYKP